jgi:tRNA(Glu) U13 pseudouridine synthase TruD
VLLRLADTAIDEETGDTFNGRALRLRFTLPAGGYATVVVTSVTSGIT